MTTDKIMHSEQREQDVQKLAQAVLEMSPNSWDNPNGANEHTCPICYESSYGQRFNSVNMSDIEHKPDCAYLIAKDLSTNIL